MIQVSIIGSGNVAHHLLKAFNESSETKVIQVFSRNSASLKAKFPNTDIISEWSLLKKADVTLIAVSDHAIGDVSDAVPFQNQLVVHTSGSIAMEEMNAKNRKGVFYPLQTFSKTKKIHFQNIPICLEAQNEKDYATLEQLAKAISDSIYPVNSEQRRALHTAAVFVCNFTNHLYRIGSDICRDHQLSFDILKPLILETAQKIEYLSPAEAQTGPAQRHDTETINRHLALLTDDNQKEIYKLLTKSIIDHGKKL